MTETKRRLACGSAWAAAIVMTSATLGGQAPPPPSKMPAAVAIDKAKIVPQNYVVPKTAWGAPDLQGVWSYATTTPLQRPDAQAGKETLTNAEIEALDEAQDARADAAPRAGDTGTYNTFWFDQGKSNGRTSLVIDPKDGKLPWTPEALKANAARTEYQRAHPADSYLSRSPTDRCIMYHGVPPVPSGYNNTYQIFETPGMVAILDENIHHVRLIPVDGRPHLSEQVQHWNGDSRGHWDGNTLVVETTNFNDKTALRYQGSSQTHAVERFTRISPRLIDYQYTITDSTRFTRPFTVSIPMAMRDDQIFEYACHEGNHSIVGILTGTRAEEKAAAEAAKKGSD